jgi:hypothetical protein
MTFEQLSSQEGFRLLSSEERTEALSHLREILLTLAGHRFQNFNMYLILIGIIAAGVLNVNEKVVIYMLCGLVIAISVIFFLSDQRVLRFVAPVRRDLEILEPLFGISVHVKDQPNQQGTLFSNFNRRVITIRWAFRMAFIVIALTAAACIIATACGAYEPTNRTREEVAAPRQGAPAAEAPNSPSPPKP